MLNQAARLGELLEAKKLYDKSEAAIKELIRSGVLTPSEGKKELKTAEDALEQTKGRVLQTGPHRDVSAVSIAAVQASIKCVKHNALKTSKHAVGLDVERSPAGVERTSTCGLCGEKGHNKRTCPHAVREEDNTQNNTRVRSAMDAQTDDNNVKAAPRTQQEVGALFCHTENANEHTNLTDSRKKRKRAIFLEKALVAPHSLGSQQCNVEMGVKVTQVIPELLVIRDECGECDDVGTTTTTLMNQTGNHGVVSLLAAEPRCEAADSSTSVPHKRAASKYNLFLKEKLEEIKISNPSLDHKQRFSEAARLWRQHQEQLLLQHQHLHHYASASNDASHAASTVSNAPASDTRASLASHMYRCSKCGQPKKGHNCPFKLSSLAPQTSKESNGDGVGESDEDTSDHNSETVHPRAVVVLDDTESDSSLPSDASSRSLDSDVENFEEDTDGEEVDADEEEEEERGEEKEEGSCDVVSYDKEAQRECPEIKTKFEAILALALSDIQKITDSGVRFNFDVAYLFRKHLTEWSRHLSHDFNNLTFREVKESVAGGRTQTGKTAFKVALSILGWRCGVSILVVTTTASSRDKICSDIANRYLACLPEDQRPPCLNISQVGGRKEHKGKLLDCVLKHGTVIINLTSAAIDSARKLIQEVRGAGRQVAWALIKDESDTMDRTADEANDPIHLERALHRLTGKTETELGTFFGAPCSILSVSATLVPIFIRIYEEGKTNVDVFNVVPDASEYCGLCPNDMQPIFMCDRELHVSNRYWSDQVSSLYRDAHPDDPQLQKEGVLLLDAANMRVHAENNIFDRAVYVQKHFPRFTVVVVSGLGGVACRMPGCEKWLKKDDIRSLVLAPACTNENDRDLDLCAAAGSQARRDKTQPYPSISDVLTAIVRLRGLDPIAVIGYTRLLRGESFVSSSCIINGTERRIVPTHLVCGCTPMRCVEDLVQMAGRVTFNGRNALRANLGAEAKVKMLIHFRDWDLALAYYRFQDEVCARLLAGKTMDQVMSNFGEEYTFASNILECKGKKYSRAIGAKKRKNNAKLLTRFQDASEVDVAEFVKCCPGRAWMTEKDFLSYNKHGVPWRLDSPIPKQETMTFNETGSIIERYLYHEEYHFFPIAVLFRRALLMAKESWQHAIIVDNQCDNLAEEYEFTKADKITLMKDLPVLRKDKYQNGCVSKISKVFSDAHAFHTGEVPVKNCWRLSPCDFPIFEERTNGNFVLHLEILRFAERFKKFLLTRPPLTTFEETEAFYDAWEQKNQAVGGALTDNAQTLKLLCGAANARKQGAAGKFETRPPLTFGGQVIEVWQQLQVPEACRALCSEKGALLGFDLEWRAPQFKGDSPGRVALMQLCSATCCVLFHLHSLQCVPPELQELLHASLLAGCGIKGDITRLVKDFRMRRPTKVVELSDLANKVLMLKRRWSLQKLVDRIIVDRHLNKSIVDVRRVDWEHWPLSKDELTYAVNDAHASYLLSDLLDASQTVHTHKPSSHSSQTASGSPLGGSPTPPPSSTLLACVKEPLAGGGTGGSARVPRAQTPAGRDELGRDEDSSPAVVVYKVTRVDDPVASLDLTDEGDGAGTRVVVVERELV